MTRSAGPAPPAGAPTLAFQDGVWTGRFTAMAGPCELLVDGGDADEARALLARVADEAWRIERKFSRYRDDSVVHAIHAAGGAPVEVDDETAQLLDYAALCWEASRGRFDVTSGVLRRVWTFDGREAVPDAAAIQAVLKHVGWNQVTWQEGRITLPAGMEIDFGGLGKEYAVDRAAADLAAHTAHAFVVNFGGDLFASGARADGSAWRVGVDDPARTGAALLGRIDLTRGGLATSGDARRFVRWRGRRLGHVLDPRTGWPVEGAPAAVTVLASTCLEAGTLATFAILQGPGAREFLEAQDVEFRIA